MILPSWNCNIKHITTWYTGLANVESHLAIPCVQNYGSLFPP